LGAIAVAATVVALSGCRAPSPAVVIEGAWSAPTPPGASAAAAYMQITARQDDVLLSANAPIAAHTTIHTTSIEEGVMRMRPLAQVSIPAGETIRFEPGGPHFMLMDLRSSQAAGSTFAMVLNFQNAGAVQIEVAVHAPGER
jgi:hypothetical protein